jgi:hypothetical protein
LKLLPNTTGENALVEDGLVRLGVGSTLPIAMTTDAQGQPSYTALTAAPGVTVSAPEGTALGDNSYVKQGAFSSSFSLDKSTGALAQSFTGTAKDTTLTYFEDLELGPTVVKVGKEATPATLKGTYNLGTVFDGSNWNLTSKVSTSNLVVTTPQYKNVEVPTSFVDDFKQGMILTINPTEAMRLAYEGAHLLPHMLNMASKSNPTELSEEKLFSELTGENLGYQGIALGNNYGFSAKSDTRLDKGFVSMFEGNIPVLLTRNSKGEIDAQSLAAAPGTTLRVLPGTTIGTQTVLRAENSPESILAELTDDSLKPRAAGYISSLKLDDQGNLLHDLSGTYHAQLTDENLKYVPGQSKITMTGAKGKPVERYDHVESVFWHFACGKRADLED